MLALPLASAALPIPLLEQLEDMEKDRYPDAPPSLCGAWESADELCKRFAFLSFVVSISVDDLYGEEPDRRPKLAEPFRTNLLELGDLWVQLKEKLDQVGRHFAAVAPRTIKWRGSLLTSIHGLVEEIASSCWHFTVSYIMEWRGINTSSLSSHAAHRDVIATTDFVEHFDTATAGLLGSVPNSKQIDKLRARLEQEFSRACSLPADFAKPTESAASLPARWLGKELDREVIICWESKKEKWRVLGQRILYEGDNEAVKELQSILGPTALSKEIEERTGRPAPSSSIAKTQTYEEEIKPLLGKPAKKPESWPKDEEPDDELDDAIDEWRQNASGKQ